MNKKDKEAMDSLELEIVRRISKYFMHHTALILTDFMHFVPFEKRRKFTTIVGDLITAERRLGELGLPPVAADNFPGETP